MALYLGIDASTQGVKVIVIDAVSIVAEASVNFGRDLPKYASPNGYLENADPTVRHADPRLWVEALHLALDRLACSGVNMGAIRGISGSGQQHGSVYLDENFALTRPTSPIWMDRSTSGECYELDERFGDRLRRDTGSPAIERFTGPQIRKFFKTDPDAYHRTRHIHLVSSFLCSEMIGQSAPIDFGDGSGMNLLNLRNLSWDPDLVEFTAPGLARKLPVAVASHTIAGGLSTQFVQYGMQAGTPVVVWSGDNPNSLVGAGASEPGIAVISLGTSDTFFAAMRDFKTDPDGCGHVFGNPAGGFMSLICFTNGSLARESMKAECGVAWDFFDNEALHITEFGNGGRMMLPYYQPESTPLMLKPGVKVNFEQASTAQRIRALLESQALSMCLHSAWQGEAFTRIRVTGGASKSQGFRQVLANVFQAEIETIAVENSAGLGAAMRAANVVGGQSFDELSSHFCKAVEVVQPDRSKEKTATQMLAAFAAFESANTVSG